MKKILLALCFVFVVILLAACKPSGKTDNVDVQIGQSSTFREAEIQDAVRAVKNKFKDFSGCTLKKLWYSEEASINMIQGYLSNGKGSQNGVAADNVIVLLCDFDVDSTGADEGFNPDSTYTGWNWILIRDSKEGKWRVDDWGY